MVGVEKQKSNILATANSALGHLFTCVFAYLLADTVADLDQLILSLMMICMREKRISIEGIHVPEHRAAQMRNVVHLEKMIPSAQPLVIRGVQDEHLVLGSTVAALGYFAAFYMFKVDVLSVFADPMETAVFFVREEGGRSVFAETRGRGEATGTSANNDDIVYFVFHFSHGSSVRLV